MAGRVQVVCDHSLDIWRLREGTGAPVVSWAPGIENPDPLGPLDRGGFIERGNAVAFALGVDRWRAEVGIIEQTVEDIDAERHALDRYRDAAKAVERRPAA